MSRPKAALRRSLFTAPALALLGLTGCGTSPGTASMPPAAIPAVAGVQAVTAAPSPSPAGIGQLGYPADGPLAVITAGPASMTWAGDASTGDQYFLVRAVLHVTAPGEVTVNSAQVVILGADGSEVGSVQVAPMMLNQGGDGYASQPMTVVSGTVPVTFVADHAALSGLYAHTAEIVSVTYDDGATAP